MVTSPVGMAQGRKSNGRVRLGTLSTLLRAVLADPPDAELVADE